MAGGDIPVGYPEWHWEDPRLPHNGEVGRKTFSPRRELASQSLCPSLEPSESPGWEGDSDTLTTLLPLGAAGTGLREDVAT